MTRKDLAIIPIICPHCKGKKEYCPICYGTGKHYKWVNKME